MNNIFFTSDTHFGHNRSFLLEPRGFKFTEDMNEAIIERWNKIVKPDDIVYHLGDMFLNNNEIGVKCMKRLNGTIFMIWGNHDSDVRKNLVAAECHISGGWYSYLIKYGKIPIYISHYPTITSNYDEKHFSQHVINLHGHTHQQTNFLYPNNPFMYHIGMDSHNCTPVHIDEIITDIRQRWNDIENLPPSIKPNDTYPYIGV